MRRNTFLFLALGLVSSVTMGVQGWTELSVKAQTELPVLNAQLPKAPATPAPPAVLGVRKQEVMYGNYKGRRINLNQNWEGAWACVVGSTKTTCFDSYAEADSFASSLVPANSRSSASAAACGTWAYVYEHAYAGGRRLQYQDSGYWQRYPSTFRNKQSSWHNTRCSGISFYDDEGRVQYNGLPNYYNGYIGNLWNDRMDQIHLWR